MKKILILLLLPVAGFCQQKGDNTVVVKDVSFKQITNALLDQGFHIEKIDSEFGILQTSHHGPRNIAYNVRVKDSTAFIQGDRAGYLVDYSWKKDFNEMVEFAKKFGPVSFAKL